jgi:uncharacterized protein (DUF1800 family)
MLTPLRANQWDPGKAAHLLNRAAFGGTPGEIQDFYALGMEKAVERMLNAPDDSVAFPKPEGIEPHDFAKLRMEMQALPEEAKTEKRKTMQQEERKQTLEMLGWWMQRMLRTPNPLREKMTLFWHGHFATSAQKVKRAYLMWQQNETLRREALGDFQVLLKEMSRDPAMMFYLDTQQSKKDHPNENFAREVMELFTLGIGNYTEEDIQQAARAFTGYKIDPSNGSFRFAPFQHDDGTKKFFGKTGNFGGDDILDMILQKPACARFISGKIWSFFAYENPSPALADTLAQSFRSQKFAIRSLLRQIFRSAEFYSPAAIRTQIKSPVQWMVETAKLLETDLPKGFVMVNSLRQMGQVPFAPPNVKGWDGGKAWISTSTLLFRYNLASFFLGHGPINIQPVRKLAGKPMTGPGMEVRTQAPPDFERIASQGIRSDTGKLVDSLCWCFYQTALKPEEKAEFVDFLKSKPAPVNDESLRDLLHLMMSTPQYQLT